MAAGLIAPWIVESWHDAVLALSFDIPTLNVDPYQRHAALTLAALALLALAWHSVGELPRAAKIKARLLMALTLLWPLAVLTSVHLDAIAVLPKFAGRFRVQPAAPAAPDVIIQTQRLPAAVALPETPMAAPPATPPSPPAPIVEPSVVSPVDVAAIETAPPPPEQAKPEPAQQAPSTPTAAANTTIKRLAANLARLMPKPAQTDMMAVYYGTDRAADTEAKRRDYTAERAGRLELGRATIQIPRAHQQTQSPRPWTAVNPGAAIQQPAGYDPGRHFAITSIIPLDHDAFLQDAALRLSASQTYKDHALIFVPGFNTSFDTALYRAAQIAYDLQFDGAPFVYSWPSTGRAANYGYDTGSIVQARTHFTQFLRTVMSETGAKSVSVIAHGLGAGLALDGLTALRDQIPPGTHVAELILTAPDIDRPAFTARMAALKGTVAHTTLYAASSDRALNISRRYTGGVPRAGDVLAGGPLVLPGVETVDVSKPGTDAVGLNHNGYVAQAALISDIARRLKGQDARDTLSAALESVATPAGSYLRLH